MWPSLLTAILPKFLDKILSFIPDKNLASKIQFEVLKMDHEGKLKELEKDLTLAVAQLEVNKNEAANRSTFVAGWRPFVGWICAISLAYQFVIAPLLVLILGAMGVAMPDLNLETDNLIMILTGMLGFGFGAFRTYEKTKLPKILDRKKIFDTIRLSKENGKFTQRDVDLINKTIDVIERN